MTVIDEGAQPALLVYDTEKANVSVVSPLPGLTVPPVRLIACELPLQLAASATGAPKDARPRIRATADDAAMMRRRRINPVRASAPGSDRTVEARRASDDDPNRCQGGYLWLSRARIGVGYDWGNEAAGG